MPVRGERQPVRFVGRLVEYDAQPERLEPPELALAANADALDRELVAGEAQRLALPRAAVAAAEGDIDERDVEPEKPADRPGAERDEQDPRREADQPEDRHQDVEPDRRQ